ncbi:MAG: SIMPL domain-containing protein [Ruminococcus sp.]|nr:SIMPL domain-containing protein [Ruminococcus sp.]
MGKIKMGGNATMEFEPDYYEFYIEVSVISGTSGNAITKGRKRIEEILWQLRDKIGIDINNIILKDEKTKALYNRKDGYEFEKQFYFRYKADNRITEDIVSLLEKMSDVEYNIEFKLENESEKEQQVLSLAVNNAKEKAEKLATALGSHITGFEEIKYKFSENSNNDVDLCDVFCLCADGSVPESLASDLKNPKIEISKTVEIVWLTD